MSNARLIALGLCAAGCICLLIGGIITNRRPDDDLYRWTFRGSTGALWAQTLGVAGIVIIGVGAAMAALP